MHEEASPKTTGIAFRRLLPPDGEVTVSCLLETWFAASRESEGRPRVAVNFAITADGAISLSSGVSGGIGDEGDLALFRGLRDRADAVLAGTGTVAAEGYGRLIRSEDRRSERETRGLAGDPLMVMISRSGELPLEAPIFESPEQRIAAFIPPGPAPTGTVAQLEVSQLDPVDPQSALESLWGQGIRSIVCEGGPKLVAGLLALDLVDDVFLTIAPKLAGGGAAGIASGPPLPLPLDLELSSVAERNGSLFVQWSRST